MKWIFVILGTLMVVSGFLSPNVRAGEVDEEGHADPSTDNNGDTAAKFELHSGISLESATICDAGDTGSECDLISNSNDGIISDCTNSHTTTGTCRHGHFITSENSADGSGLSITSKATSANVIYHGISDANGFVDNRWCKSLLGYSNQDVSHKVYVTTYLSDETFPFSQNTWNGDVSVSGELLVDTENLFSEFHNNCPTFSTWSDDGDETLLGYASTSGPYPDGIENPSSGTVYSYGKVYNLHYFQSQKYGTAGMRTELTYQKNAIWWT